MAYIYSQGAELQINFLESEVGLVLKTCQVDSTLGETDEYNNIIVKAGTIYPADDASAEGIITEDIDVTHGEKAASMLAAGRVLKDRLDISDEAVTALSALGVVFCDFPVIEREIEEDEETADAEDGE